MLCKQVSTGSQQVGKLHTAHSTSADLQEHVEESENQLASPLFFVREDPATHISVQSTCMYVHYSIAAMQAHPPATTEPLHGVLVLVIRLSR